ncbi:MAG: DUF2771 domain-containing protein [Corynebacterium sp.]|nr:DUF2771 domain-containing protein [Corynebacterium sp.]
MSSRRKKNAIQFVSLLVIVLIVVGASWAVMRWYSNRPGPDPREVHLSATINGEKIDIAPYAACEIGESCPEGTTTDVDLGPEDTMSIELPADVYDHEWSLLKIYDDPAANDQSTFGSNQQKSVDIAGSTEPLIEGGERPRLVVVEISSLLIGTDEDGNESPYTVTWSIHPKDTVINTDALSGDAGSTETEATTPSN